MENSELFNNFKGYQGNSLLKRSGIQINWTKELVEEYIKCSKNPIYFIETYMKIISIDDGLINFKLRDYQKEMICSMSDNRYTIIATARQAGKSTTTCGFILWYIIFHADKTVALLANKGETAREILGRVQLAYEHLPKWLQQGIVEFNKGSFLLENNSRVIAAATSASAIRGYSINLLFIDEAAHIFNWNEFFTSVFPTISSGSKSKIVLVSTPNGLNHFYKLWHDSEENRNSYNRIRVSWESVPGRDDSWKDETLAAMAYDYDKFRQEHEVEFLGSSGTLISGWKLMELSHSTPLESNMGLNLYLKPEKDHKYVLVADVSRGKGLDFSAFQIIDTTVMPYVQACTYRNNMITPMDYVNIIYKTAKAFNDAFVLVEINDIGEQVSSGLLYDFEYENVLCTENHGARGKRLTGLGSNKATDKGVRTTKSVKNVGCSVLKLLVEQNQIILHDFNTINELSRFSKKGNSYEAESGANDDLVMGLVLFSWMTNQQLFKDLTDINTLIKLREMNEEQLEAEMLPFGFVDNGLPDPEVIDVVADRWLWS